MEDEEAVRSAMKSVLSAHGYRAIEAANAAEAEAAAGEFPGDIHLLLTDVIMPGINGKELSERLRRLRPGLKTIFMSGYSENVIAERGLLGQGVSYIPKPFSPNGLARKLREVLGGAESRPSKRKIEALPPIVKIRAPASVNHAGVVRLGHVTAGWPSYRYRSERLRLK